MPTFPTPSPISISVDLSVVGDVRVNATDRIDTVVDVHPKDAAKHADVAAAEQTTVELVGGVLGVKARGTPVCSAPSARTERSR